MEEESFSEESSFLGTDADSFEKNREIKQRKVIEN